MRIITCSKYNAHTDPIFKSLNLLKIQDIFNLSLLKFIFKLENDMLPVYFYSMFISDPVTHSHNTRFRPMNRPPIPPTSSAEETVRYHLPNFIRTVPSIIKDKIHSHSYKGFTHYVKILYIKCYSSECDIPGCYICNS